MSIIKSDKKVGNFLDAHQEAWRIAREKIGKDAVMWSWNNEGISKHSPPVDCCGDECEEPAWEIYGLSRGADLKVTLDGGNFEFLFGPPPF